MQDEDLLVCRARATEAIGIIAIAVGLDAVRDHLMRCLVGVLEVRCCHRTANLIAIREENAMIMGSKATVHLQPWVREVFVDLIGN